MKNLKNKYLKTSKVSIFISSVFVLFFVFVSYSYVFADQETNSNTIKLETRINNPLGNSFSDLPSFINTLVDVALVIGIPLITLAIIYSGFLFVSAQGNPKELETAKKNFTYTIIGAALLLGALVIANAIKDTITSIKA